MIDLKRLRDDSEACQAQLATRGEYDLQPILDLDSQQREIEQTRSQLQARSNGIGKEVGLAIKNGADPKGPEVKALKDEGSQLKAQLAELEPKERELKAEIESLLLELPNIPSPSTPVGKDETENVEVTDSSSKDRYEVSR